MIACPLSIDVEFIDRENCKPKVEFTVYVLVAPANCEGVVTVSDADEAVVVELSVEDVPLGLVVVFVAALVVELTVLLNVDMGVIVALVETEVLEIPIISEIPIPRMITRTTTIATAMILLFLLPPAELPLESMLPSWWS